MRLYKDVKHITTNISKNFENELREAIRHYQDRGYLVEIQQSYHNNVFSAVVLPYEPVGRFDLLETNLDD